VKPFLTPNFVFPKLRSVFFFISLVLQVTSFQSTFSVSTSTLMFHLSLASPLSCCPSSLFYNYFDSISSVLLMFHLLDSFPLLHLLLVHLSMVIICQEVVTDHIGVLMTCDVIFQTTNGGI
jgi:hypothetical protein